MNSQKNQRMPDTKQGKMISIASWAMFLAAVAVYFCVGSSEAQQAPWLYLIMGLCAAGILLRTVYLLRQRDTTRR